MQLPDRYDREDQNQKVGQNVEDAASVVRGFEIEAMAAYQWIPNSFTWDAQNNHDNGGDQVEEEDTPDVDLNYHVEYHVALSIWNENPQVLKQD